MTQPCMTIVSYCACMCRSTARRSEWHFGASSARRYVTVFEQL